MKWTMFEPNPIIRQLYDENTLTHIVRHKCRFQSLTSSNESAHEDGCKDI